MPHATHIVEIKLIFWLLSDWNVHSYVSNLPADFAGTPLGQMMTPIINQFFNGAFLACTFPESRSVREKKDNFWLFNRSPVHAV